jgi:hypothetical protein
LNKIIIIGLAQDKIEDKKMTSSKKSKIACASEGTNVKYENCKKSKLKSEIIEMGGKIFLIDRKDKRIFFTSGQFCQHFMS